jgi:hypothetical protein
MIFGQVAEKFKGTGSDSDEPLIGLSRRLPHDAIATAAMEDLQ